jgi:beta-galactosidase
MDSRVWFNGKLLSEHPYGYTSFGMELPEPRWGRDNTVAVQVRNDGFNSRWYSGSGIYRHVHLTVTEPVHIAHQGLALTTPLATLHRASVDLAVKIKVPAQSRKLGLRTTLLDPQGKKVATEEVEVFVGRESGAFRQRLELERPSLWSPDEPHLYSALVQVFEGNRLTDAQALHFGIRSADLSTQAGFRLNGQKLILRGGCMHHDQGILGARAFDASEERRVRLMKENGFNAVRTSHNPPSEAFLEACDRLGFLVLDEAFDQWQGKTNDQDYHRFHARWWKKDLEALVLRDRNHPCVLMWSIGNEISDKEKPATARLARQQADFVRALDPSRPVTEGINGSDKLWIALDSYMEAHDVHGYNYMERWYEKDHARVPGRVMYQSESSNQRIFESAMAAQDMPWVVGDFVWTGFDYIGEASIGYHSFDLSKRENRMWTLAYCGDLDLCGYKRPQSYYREAVSGTGPKISAMVRSPFPSFGPRQAGTWCFVDVQAHWTWPGWEGKKLTVEVYSRCERVELRLNGRLVGRAKPSRANKFRPSFKISYQPGALLAEGFEGKKKVAKWALQTTGKPAALRLQAERSSLKADGQDLAFVHVEVLDRLGRRVPFADNLVKLEISGAAHQLGFGSSHPQNLESFQDQEHRAFEGRALLALRAGKSKGQVRIKAFSEGLKPASISLRVL